MMRHHNACFGIFQSIPEQSALRSEHCAVQCFGKCQCSKADNSININSFFVIFLNSILIDLAHLAPKIRGRRTIL